MRHLLFGLFALTLGCGDDPTGSCGEHYEPSDLPYTHFCSVVQLCRTGSADLSTPFIIECGSSQEIWSSISPCLDPDLECRWVPPGDNAYDLGLVSAKDCETLLTCLADLGL